MAQLPLLAFLLLGRAVLLLLSPGLRLRLEALCKDCSSFDDDLSVAKNSITLEHRILGIE